MTTVTISSPIGPLGLTTQSGRLTSVWFVGSWRSPGAGLNRRVDGSVEPVDGQPVEDPVLATTIGQLAEYFRGEREAFDLPIAVAGEAFQQRVWEQIAAIGYGQTRAYGDIARALGDVGLSQAVGRATGSNPLPLVIGCHRVLGTDGSLTGFGGGLDRKRFLLALEEGEQARTARLF